MRYDITHRRVLSCFVLLMCFAWTAAASAQDKVEPVSLKPDLTVGTVTTYKYWSKRDIQVVIEAAGNRRDSSTAIESTGTMTFKIDEVKDDGTILGTLTYNKITLNVTGPDGTVKSNDSEGTGDIPPLQNLITTLVDNPLQVEIDPKGEAVSIKGMDAIKSQLDNPDAMPKERDFLETARALIAVVNAPAKATPGTTWTESFEGSHQMGTMKKTSTWKLDEVGQIEGIDIASLSATTKLDLNVDRSKTPPNAPPIDVQMPESQGSAKVLFDLDTHQIVMSDSTSNTTIKVNVTMGAQTLTQTITESDRQQMWRDDIQIPE